MTYGFTIDVEDALRTELSSAGIESSAPPVPANLGEALPWACVERTGGMESGPVQDTHAVDVDVYASTEAGAMSAADRVCGIVRNLEGRPLGGVPCYRAGVSTLPYNNPDPRHPTLARCTVKVQIVTRTGA